ncbi:hypothetical protein O0L34_g10274 [Tuta absoluta]|nr:hypothetical protein O0L34_g10274 [Tuta absoluta]
MTAAEKSRWVCVACLSELPKTGNSDTPVKTTAKSSTAHGRNTGRDSGDYKTSNVTVRPKSKSSTGSTQDNGGRDNPKIDTTLQDDISSKNLLNSLSRLLDAKLAPSSQFMTNLRVEISDLINKDIKTTIQTEVRVAVHKLKEELVKDFTSTTDFLSAEQKDLKMLISEKDDTIKTLQSEQIKIQSELNELRSRFGAVEKISRDRNIELQAVPEKGKENVVGVFQNLCKALNVEVPDRDIHACRRVAKLDPSSDRPRNILITLSSPRQRDVVLSAAHRFNKANPREMLNTFHLGMTGGETTRIYLSEHLSPQCKRLHAAARKFRKNMNYKYCWVTNGNVYLRKNDNYEAIRVKDLAVLTKLEAKEDNSQ